MNEQTKAPERIWVTPIVGGTIDDEMLAGWRNEGSGHQFIRADIAAEQVREAYGRARAEKAEAAIMLTDHQTSAESLGAAVFWPIVAVLGIVVILWNVPVKTTRRIRIDLKNRGVLREFEEFLAERRNADKENTDDQ